MNIENHRLSGVRLVPAADQGGALTAPLMLVIHYTAGASAESSITHLTRKDDVYVSAHLVIARGGTVTQLVPFDRVAWHAGKSEWEGRSNCNTFSIGIELANAGPLTLDSEGVLRTWFGAIVLAENAIERDGQWWERFPAAQMQSCVEVCRALRRQYPSITSIVGHNDVAPKRKIDPGAAFPWADFMWDVTKPDPVLEAPYTEPEKMYTATEVLSIIEKALSAGKGKT